MPFLKQKKLRGGPRAGGDGTTTEGLWESRSLPGFILNARCILIMPGVFVYDKLN